MVIHALWMTAALSCDGDSFSMTAATSPSIEDLVQGIVPGMPRLSLHHPLLAFENGQEFLSAWFDAAEGRLQPFILVVEGSIPNEKLSGDGYWAGLGADPQSGQPIPTTEWISRLAARAAVVVAVGTCATYGGVPAMKNNPTGAMGLPDYLGWDWRSSEGVPLVCIPGCPAQPDNITETLLYLTLMLSGKAPAIELDDSLRPRWLFNRTVHECCDRAAFYEQGEFAQEYGSSKCMVKLGCKGPVVKCNVGVRGWLRGRGGCPNVGGICIGCTMPGFPDKFMPFMNAAYPVRVSTNVARFSYGPVLKVLRRQSIKKGERTPEWRRPTPAVATGLAPHWDVPSPTRSPAFRVYEAGGRLARRYPLGKAEHVRVEVHDNRILLGWSTLLDAGAWLESLHDFVGIEGNALGLIIPESGTDTRGDLTWRETRSWLHRSAQPPRLVRLDLGSVSLLWTRSTAESNGARESSVLSPAFDAARFEQLIEATGTAMVRDRSQEILRDARLVRRWRRDGESEIS
jgi:hydrogenase small subunit